MSLRIRSFIFIPVAVLLISILAACGTGQTSTSAPATVGIAQATTAPSTIAANPTSIATDTTAATSAPANNSDATTNRKINLNTASAQEILAIPNTGNRMVREFQEYRPYTTILQFRKEIGKYVDEQTVAEYEKYVYVPIDMNASDAATLQQIPGFDANGAAELIALRPFASKDAFLSALSKYIPADELGVAQQYLAS